MAEAGGCSYDRNRVVENCLKILQNPTHQNGLKYSTFLNIYHRKFEHPFPVNQNQDHFFASFATASSNLQCIPWKTPSKIVIKVRPEYAKNSVEHRDSAPSCSSSSKEKFVQYTKEHFRYDVSNVLSNSPQNEWLISEFLRAFANFAKREFPEPQDFGFAKQQELFEILGDICKLERKGNQIFVHNLLAPNFSHSCQKRSVGSISNDSVQEVRSPNFHQNMPSLLDLEDPFMSQPIHMETKQHRQHHDPVRGMQPFMMTVKDYPYAHKLLKANDKIKDIVGPLQFSQISEGLKEVPFDQLCAMIDDFSFRQGKQLMDFVTYHHQSCNESSIHSMQDVKVEPDTPSSSTALEYISLQTKPPPAPNLPGAPKPNNHDQLHILAEKKLQGNGILSEQSVLPRELRSMADIDTACKIVVQNMNAKKEFVSASKIELALLQYYGKRQLVDFGIGNVRAAHHVETLKNLNMKERKVVLYVELFVKMRSICTIHELESLLIKLQVPDSEFSGSTNNNNNSSFEDLYQLGPLYKHPVIYDHFKFPTDGSAQPREINSYHVANIFRDYMTKKNLWHSRELQTADFLTFLAKTLDVENPWNLGVKIVSLPLLKSTICRAQADSKKEQDKLISQIVNSLVDDMRKESDYLRQQIGKAIGIASNGNHRHMNSIKTMSTVELLKHCYNACLPLLEYVDSDTPNDSKLSKRKKANKFAEVCRRFQSFFETCQNQPVAQAIFELCIVSSCKMGNPDLIKEAIVFVLDNQKLWEDILRFCPVECLPSSSGDAGNAKQPEVFDLTSDSSSEDEAEFTYEQIVEEREKQRKNFLSELEEKIENMLKEALRSNSDFSNQISLNQLEAIEQSVYKFDSENLLWSRHKMSFLGLIVSRPLLLKEFTSVIGGRSTNERTDGNFWKCSSNNELKEFLSQCGANSENLNSVATALKRTFDIDVSDENLRKKICSTAENKDPQSDKSFILYAESLTLSEDLTSSVLQKEELSFLVLNQIINIPFMKNLLSSLHWDALFRPELGEFVPFLRKNKSYLMAHDIKFFISCEDCVFKVPATSSYELLTSSALSNEPLKFCAVLLSLVDTNDSIAQFPYQLAQSELYAAFNSLTQNRCLISFLSYALIAFPANFSVPIWRDLLKPLAEKVGTVDIEAKLLDHVSSQDDKLALLKLAMVGNLAGIRLWAELLVGEPSIKTVAKNERSVRLIEPASVTGNDDAAFVMDVDISRKDQAPQSSSNLDEVGKDATMEVDKEQENECRKIVDEILMNEFGEGLQMDEKAREILNKHQDRIGRSLERLSKELYSQDIHFILELIQNADDNFYTIATESGEQPTLVFRLDSEKLAIFNNEDGFRAENLKALCDVGKTTKGKHRKGLIGQKGIGFKSVFRVTDTPEIHSSGFHVRFDVNNGALGMIKPVWIEEENREEILELGNLKELLGSQNKYDFTTQILLPFSSHSANVKAFKTKLQQVEPSLLLFLNKLTRILIQIDVCDDGNSSEAVKENLMLEREFMNNRIVRVQSNESCDFFLVETVSVEVPEHLNVKLDETEISFAFPLEMTASDSFRFSYARTMQAFAFLPVRDFGLKFIIHADFEIPSSRQDIDCDSAFNQWISQKIPQLYIDTFEKFLTIIKDPVQASISFLSYLPLPNEIFGFFKSVAHKTCEMVQSACVIPTIENELCVPSQVIQWNELLGGSENIDSELFTKATGWKLAHAHLNKLRPAVVQQLGLHCVSLNDFLVTLEYYTTSQSFENEAENEKVVVVKKLLMTILQNFSHQLSHDILVRVKKIPFILLSNGKWVDMQKNSDLFCNTEQDYASLSKLKMLKLVDSKMLLDDTNKVIPEIQKFLINMGVKLSSTKELLKFHVSDVLSNEEKWSALGTESLRDYTRFLVKGWQNFHLGENDVQKFLSNLPILVCKGGSTEVTQMRSEKTIYFPSQYKPSLCLPQVFPGFTFNTLSDIYVCDYEDAKIFREFFSKVGVREFFEFQKVETPLSENGLLKRIDYASDLVTILETCSKLDQNQAKQLFTLLSHHWNDIMDFIFAREIEAGSQAVKLVPSSVSKALLENNWVPAQFQGKQIFAKPGDLFILTTEVKQIFRNDVQVLNHSINVNLIRPEFLNFLRIKNSVSVDDVLTYLRNCSQISEFKSDFGHMSHVYTFLDRNIDECLEVLRNESLICLPEPSSGGSSFFEPSRLVMDEPSELYEKYRPTLLKYKATAPIITFFRDIRPYRFLDAFFETIGASAVPTENMYRDLMLFLINALDMTKNELSKENRISDLFQLIALSCNKITDEDACFPCSNRTFASRKDEIVLYDQDQLLYSLFKDNEKLKILHPDVFNQPAEFQNRILGTALKGKYSLLSNVINENIISGQIWTCSKVHSFVYFACPYIQRYLSSSYRSVYNQNKDIFANKVSLLKFYACKEFEIIYTYKDSLNVSITKPIFCNGKEFYVAQAHLDDWKLIGKEVAVLFSLGNKDWETNLCMFVDLLVKYFLKEPGHKKVSALVDQFEIPNLPDGELEWNVPKPEYSKVVIDMELRKNRGEAVNTTFGDIDEKKDNQQNEKESSAKKPGQWPPLPPRGCKAANSGNVSLNRDAISELPPPPKPPKDWNATGIRLPPRMVAIEANRAPGSAAIVSNEDEGVAINFGSSSDEVTTEHAPLTSSNSIPIPGGKRTSQDIVSSPENNNKNSVMSPPRMSAEKKLKTCEDETRPPIMSDRGDENEFIGDIGRNEREQLTNRNTEKELQEVKSVNLSVTTPNVAFVSSVTCQLESMDLVSAAGSGSSSTLQSIIPPRPMNVKDDGKSLLVGRFGEQLVFNMLRSTAPQGAVVSWVNENCEQYKPFDITVTQPNGGPTDYIEVKATSAAHSEYFRISIQELKFASECGPMYLMYFVFNAMEDKPTVKYFSNLRNKLDTNQVSLLLNLHK